MLGRSEALRRQLDTQTAAYIGYFQPLSALMLVQRATLALGLIFQWLKEQGGLEAVKRVNDAKQKALYSAIDASELYTNPINVADRSWMNIPFRLADDRLDKPFLAGAEERGLLNLKGETPR